MTVAGTLSPFHRVWVTVMPAGSHERDMGDTARGHDAVCAMVIPLTACKTHALRRQQVGRSTKSPQYPEPRARRVCTAHAPRTVLPLGVGVSLAWPPRTARGAALWYP